MNAGLWNRFELFFGRKLTLRHFLTSRRIVTGLLGILVVAALVTSLAASPSSERGPVTEATSTATANEPLRVDARAVISVDSFPVGRRYAGTLSARRTSDLGFERSAKVVEVLVDEGDRVEKGEPLARLDTRQLEIEITRTQARRAEAASVLDELKAGPRLETIEAARAEFRDFQAQVELQNRTYLRTQRLIEKEAASKERLDQTELGLRSAEAKLGAAQRRLDELEAGSRVERITAQAAVVAQLDAELEDLAIERLDSTLVAPFDGRISRRDVDEGAVVSPAQRIVQVIESGVLEARIGLPASVVANLEPGQPLELIVGDQTYPATFDRVLPEVDRQTRTQLAVLSVDSSATECLVPGQVARVLIDQSQQTDGFWVPTTSLVRGFRGLWAVFVVEPGGDGSGHVMRRDVEVLHADGPRALVRGTLSDGDRVIGSGTHRVVPGQLVTVK